MNPANFLIGVVSSEVDKCSPQWAYRGYPAPHLDFFADILGGFRIVYHYRLRNPDLL